MFKSAACLAVAAALSLGALAWGQPDQFAGWTAPPRQA